MPRIRALASPNVASVALWGAILVLICVAIHVSDQAEQRTKAEQAKFQAERQARIDRVRAMPADAPVSEFLPYLDFEETRFEALPRIKASRRKQQDLEAMLAEGDFSRMDWMRRFDIRATPVVCSAMRAFLGGRIAAAKAAIPVKGYAPLVDDNSFDTLESLDHFAANGCTILPQYTEWLALLHASPDPSPMTYNRLKWMDQSKAEMEKARTGVPDIAAGQKR